ncbi:hypothetical protein [Bradyrhizobium sp. NAS96.2]|uniref:hypothetical protein n=1 Tax=Bradyrhizobium sp. NAS96.2 TaxID=1680160 RepID=UPI001160F134|nr:hypothetical protein [Bradyrhizobium sp. NAS96.2]
MSAAYCWFSSFRRFSSDSADANAWAAKYSNATQDNIRKRKKDYVESERQVAAHIGRQIVNSRHCAALDLGDRHRSDRRLYFAFSTFIMNALDRAGLSTAVSAMNAIKC